MVQAAPGSSTSKECCAVPLLLLSPKEKYDNTGIIQTDYFAKVADVCNLSTT